MYIYLIWEREFWSQNKNIYKIGKSKQQNCRRISSYPKNSKIILIITVDDVDQTEKKLINLFKETFIQRLDIGTEYFQGDCKTMIDLITEYSADPSNGNYSYDEFEEEYDNSERLTKENQKKEKKENSDY